MENCPAAEVLQRLLDQSLPEPLQREIEIHVENCPRCPERLDELTKGAGGVLFPLAVQMRSVWVQQQPALLTVRPTIPNYEILAELERGGTSVVYKARHLPLNRIIALKMFVGGALAAPERRARFGAEAEMIAQLRHPNIVQIFEVGEYEGQPFLALEFMERGSLAPRLDGKAQPPQEAARTVATLARAIHYAHQQGIVHRDLKPANVLVDEAGVHKVSDFGLAKTVNQAGRSVDGAIIGTAAYMAPEQAEGKVTAIGPATDVYGLGVILYEMLTGRRPFGGESDLDTLEQVRTQDPLPPRRLERKLPRDVETICLKCLEKEPARRYATAEALGDDLRRFLQDRPIRARPVGAVEWAWRWCRRNPVIAVMAAALVLAMLGGFSATLVQWRRAEAHLIREEAARREAEDNYARLRDMVVANIYRSATHIVARPDLTPVRQAMLQDAESCLALLLQRRDKDPELQLLLAVVRTQQGEILFWQHRNAEVLVALESAERLWNQLSSEEASNRERQVGHAMTCFYLEQAYEQQGSPDLAQQAFARAFDLWRTVEVEFPKLLPRQKSRVGYWVELARILIPTSVSESDAARRFAEIEERLKRIGSGPDSTFFLALLRVQYLHAKAESHLLAHQMAGVAAAAREAATMLARLLAQTSIRDTMRCHLAHWAVQVSLLLRRAKLPEEALRLSEQANGVLQEAVKAVSTEHYLLEMLSISWGEIGRIRWTLGQTEETLVACRNALEAQRTLLSLAPAEPEFRQILGSRYAELARKLCVLGRLDDAEACFRERQALWPGDRAKQAAALQDLQEWAARVGIGKKNLSAEEQQERQRYVDLYARLAGV